MRISPSAAFNNIKTRLWQVENPGSMLMHTGALGWAASSAAQITGMLFNDNIDTNKKKFLIPQEFADAAGNIALYYAVTLVLKRTVEDMFEFGRVRLAQVDRALEERAKCLGCNVRDLFNENKSMSKILESLPDAKAVFDKHKKGASLIATLIASVISCNILTPYFRNITASKLQKLNKENTANANAEIFNMTVKSNVKTEKPPVFNGFIV